MPLAQEVNKFSCFQVTKEKFGTSRVERLGIGLYSLGDIAGKMVSLCS